MNTLFLIKYLKHKRITVYQLSKRTGLNESNLGKILNKKTKNPRIDYLLTIAKALDLNEQEFAELCDYKVNKQSCIPLDIKDENDTHYGGNPLYGKWITGTCPKCKQDVQSGMNQNQQITLLLIIDFIFALVSIVTIKRKPLWTNFLIKRILTLLFCNIVFFLTLYLLHWRI